MWKLGRQLVAALSVAASTIVTGCSSVPRASPEADAEGKRFTPPPAGQGALYVYRGGVLGGAYVFPISAADRQLGTLPAGAWLRRDLEAGQYDVRCTGGENVASIVVPLAAGETRFVSVTTGVGWAAPRCGLAEVSAAEGRAGVLARRRIQEPAAVAAPRAIPSAPAVVSATSSASSSAVAAGLATSPASDPRREAARAGEAYHGGNYAEALKLLKVQADQGQAYAQLKLGDFYSHGLGVRPDKWEAVKWYRRAADQGHAVAQYSLGTMYLPGDSDGIPPSTQDAVRWIRQSAEQGFARAQELMGEFYLEGFGVPQDTAQAVAWFRKAADQGDGIAQFYLGTIYLTGRHLPVDYRLALQWSRKAADQGIAEAQFNVGLIYLQGWGVPVDFEQARRWFTQAAGQGYGRARTQLVQPPFG